MQEVYDKEIIVSDQAIFAKTMANSDIVLNGVFPSRFRPVSNHTMLLRNTILVTCILAEPKVTGIKQCVKGPESPTMHCAQGRSNPPFSMPSKFL